MRLPGPLVIALWLAAAAVSVWLAATHLTVNTDTADMIAAELPFRKAYDTYRRQFPLQAESLVVVIDGQTPEAAERAAIALGDALRQQPAQFSDIDVPGTGPFFDRNGFLYLSESELQDLSNRLVEGQPFLGLLQRDPSLRGFAETLRQVVNAPPGNAVSGLAPVLNEFSSAIDAELRGAAYQVSWQKMLAGDSPNLISARRFVLALPTLDPTDLFAAAKPIAAIRQTATRLGLTPGQGVRIRITGDVALSFEEFQSALEGTKISNVLAIIIVTALLAYGLRSVWLTLASLLALLVGLAVTAGFAAIAVGQLNLISLAFAVLYIGLSVDYAINYCLRYRECLVEKPDKPPALRDATRAVAPPLLMCALTTCIGFYAFLPTDFAGVAQLGLISGTGMLINLAVTLTLLPALLERVPMPSAREDTLLLPAWYRQLPYRLSTPVRVTTILLAAGALTLLPRLSFDRNPLNLRDARSESVATIRDLMTASEQPVMGITILAPDAGAAKTMVEQLRHLPEAGQVISAADFVPEVTDAKLAILDELSLLVAPELQPAQASTPASPRDTNEALRRLESELRRFAARNPKPDGGAATRLAEGIGKLENVAATGKDADPAQRLSSLQSRLLATLPQNLKRLNLALESRDPGAALEVPKEISSRWVTPAGVQRIAVFPRKPIANNQELRRFVESVERIAPAATDEPVMSLRAGDTVVKAFLQAMTLAAIGMLVVVVVLLRRTAAVILVTLPLLLAGVLTGATMVVLNVPFNFANVLALPLLMGVGVDFGVLIVQRMYQHHGLPVDPLQTSTGRAVLFSGLATTCGIGNLVFSTHPGTASMGLVLTIGLAYSVVCTLLVLPAFSAIVRTSASKT
jgi:hopanoid biosynthesis associated RND transporter like protein HpnN